MIALLASLHGAFMGGLVWHLVDGDALATAVAETSKAAWGLAALLAVFPAGFAAGAGTAAGMTARRFGRRSAWTAAAITASAWSTGMFFVLFAIDAKLDEIASAMGHC